MPTPFRTGKFGGAVVAGASLKITGWTFDDNGDVKKVRDTGGGGFSRLVMGFRDGAGEITAMFRTDQTPAIAAPTIAPGTRLTLDLHIDETAGTPKIVIPEVMVTNVSLVSASDAETTYSFSYETDGSWTELDGSLATNALF